MEIRYSGGFCGPLEFGYPFRYFALPVVPSILMCPGTHDTSILSLLFSSMKVVALPFPLTSAMLVGSALGSLSLSH